MLRLLSSSHTCAFDAPIWEKITGLLGPLDESGAKWRSWGETLGSIAGGGVAALIGGIEKIAGALGWVVDLAKAGGQALASFFSAGDSSSPQATPAKRPTPASGIMSKKPRELIEGVKPRSSPTGPRGASLQDLQQSADAAKSSLVAIDAAQVSPSVDTRSVDNALAKIERLRSAIIEVNGLRIQAPADLAPNLRSLHSDWGPE